MNKFQESFKELLNEKQINCYQLSKILNIPSSTLNGYLTTKYYPSISNALKMCKYFNCSLDYLFGLSDVRDYCPIKKYNSNTFFDNLQNLFVSTNTPIAKALREMKMGEYNYYRWKQGKFPKTSNLIEIAKYFNVSLDFLIGDNNGKI